MRTHLSVKQLIEQWLSEQDINQASRQTYERVFRQFQFWLLNQNIKIATFNTGHFVKYKNYLIETKSTKTVDLYLTIVRRFWKFLELKKIHENVTYGIKNPKRNKAFSKAPLQPSQASALMNIIPKDRITGLRDFAIINLMLRTGLRSIEVTRLDVGDILEIQGHHVLKIQGKGMSDKRQMVPITLKSLTPIHDYLIMRGEFTDLDPLFTRHQFHRTQGRITPNFVGRMIKHYMKQINIDSKEFSGHSLRHSFAYNAIKNGASLYDVQMMLRHTTANVTQLYLKQIEQEKMIINPVSALFDEIY